MPFKPGNKIGKGGPRPNAGRKPVARYLAAIEQIANDPATPAETKLAALVYLIDRALGKPRQPIDLTANVAVRLLPGGGEGDIAEHMDAMTAADATTADLRKIAADPAQPSARRTAAVRMVRMVESPTMAAFEPWLHGRKTMAELRDGGVDVNAVKSATVGEDGSRTVLLYDDYGGPDFDRMMRLADGPPTLHLRWPGTEGFREAVRNAYAAGAAQAAKAAVEE